MTGVIAVLVAVSTVAVYEFYARPASPPLPVAWTVPTSCGDCTVATSNHTLFVLGLLNQSSHGASNYSISAYNFSTGALLWRSPAFTIWEIGGFVGSGSTFFVNRDTLTFVDQGEKVTVPGYGTQAPGFCSFFILEWNATSGQYLGTSRTDSPYSCPAIAYVAHDQGWLSLAYLGSWPSTSNLTVQTFSEPKHSNTYRAWSERLDLGTPRGSDFIPDYFFLMTDGDVVISTTLGSNLTTVLNGTTGGIEWVGPLPEWFIPSFSPYILNEPKNLLTSSTGLYYIAQNGSTVTLRSFNLTSHSSVTVTELIGVSALWSDLTRTPSGHFLVTDLADRTYSCYTSGGAFLWNRTLSVQVTGGTSTPELAVPFPIGSGELFLAFQSFAEGVEGKSTVTTTTPFLLVSESDGDVEWHSSYTFSWSGGYGPEWYVPRLSSGPSLLYQFNQTLSVADLG